MLFCMLVSATRRAFRTPERSHRDCRSRATTRLRRGKTVCSCKRPSASDFASRICLRKSSAQCMLARPDCDEVVEPSRTFVASLAGPAIRGHPIDDTAAAAKRAASRQPKLRSSSRTSTQRADAHCPLVHFPPARRAGFLTVFACLVLFLPRSSYCSTAMRALSFRSRRWRTASTSF